MWQRISCLGFLLVSWGCAIGCPQPNPEPKPCPSGQAHDQRGVCRWQYPRQACPAGQFRQVGQDKCQPVGPGPCLEPFVKTSDDDWGCTPLLPAETCPQGSMPQLGQGSCQPVGWYNCAEGFVESTSGCQAVLPAAPCGAGQVAVVGQSICHPLGDCNAVFPPAQADILVDELFGEAQLDATHHRQIATAVAAAEPGATIAIERGVYQETLLLNKEVHLVGRCASQVILSPASSGDGPGLQVNNSQVTLQGLTVQGFDVGIEVTQGGQLDGSLLQLLDSMATAVHVRDAGSHVDLTTVLIRGTRPRPNDVSGRGVNAVLGGTAHLQQVQISDSREAGLFAADDSSITVVNGLVETTLAAAGEDTAYGAIAYEGGHLDLRQSVIASNQTHGVLVSGQTSSASLLECEVRDNQNGERVAGIQVKNGAQLNLQRVALSRNHGAALLASSDAVVTVTQSLLQDTQTAAQSTMACGVLAFDGARVTLRETLLRNLTMGLLSYDDAVVTASHSLVMGGPDSTGGYVSSGVLQLDHCSIQQHPIAGLHVEQAGALELSHTLVTGGTPSANSMSSGLFICESSHATVSQSAVVGVTGHAAAVWDAGSELQIQRSLILDTRSSSETVGVAALVGNNAQLTMTDSRILNSHGNGLQGDHNSVVELHRSVIQGTQASRDINGMAVMAAGTLSLDQSAIVDSQLAGVFLGGGQHQISRSLITGSGTTTAGLYGHGLVASGGSEVVAEGCEISSSAAVGLVFSSSSGGVGRSIIAGNSIGFLSQVGSELHQVEESPSRLEPLQVYITADTVFTDNATQIGLQEVPLPDPFADE